MATCSCHAHAAPRLHVHRELDPTRTTSIRRRLERRSNSLWRQLRGEARERLDAMDHPLTEDQRREYVRWFERRAFELLLEASPQQDAEDISAPDWMRGPVDEAIEKGAERGASFVEAAGVALGIGAAAILLRDGGRERIAEMRRRIVEETAGVIGATRQQVQRDLRDSPTKTAAMGAVSDRMRKVGESRMRLIARTEIVRGANKGAMAVYEYAETDEIGVQAEMVNWVTAGDERVCDECESLAAGGPYKRSEAENMLPAHANCRCMLVPVIRKG